MISAPDLMALLRPLHVCVGRTGHIVQSGTGLAKMGSGDLEGQRFLEVFEIMRPTTPHDMAGLRAMAGQVVRLRLRSQSDIILRALVIDDLAGGAILDLSFGIAVVDAVQRFGLTAQDFSPGDLAVELLFLQEAKSSAMAASFSLNSRLNGARLAAETEALTDGLTGLHNRRALNGALSRLALSDTGYAILHIDLDRFKEVNDTLGHAAGDAILRTVAAIMRSQTRQDDLLVRTGGDEFVIICPGLTDLSRLKDLSNTLISQISEPVVTEGREARIGASIGIALRATDTRIDPDILMERADIALFAAKRTGRGRHMVWSPDLGHSLSDLDLPHVSARS
jgi:diguanylate cyclase (GGDEF)-like protein